MRPSLPVLFLIVMGAGAVPAAAEESAPYLDVDIDTADRALATTHELVATVKAADHTTPLVGQTVTFRFEQGPNAAAEMRTCEAPTDISGTCRLSFRGSATEGVDTIRAWIEDGNPLPLEADQLEPRGPDDQDGTDVVEVDWHPAELDVYPETETNAVGEDTTLAFIALSTREPGLHLYADVKFDVETGPNAAAEGVEGCEPTPLLACPALYRGNGGAGTDLLRAWIDEDGDTQPDEADPSEGVDESLAAGSSPEPDATDLIERIWTQDGDGGDEGECPGLEGFEGNLIVGTSGDDVLTGTPGDDIICGLGGMDTIETGDGDDAIVAGTGQAVIDAGDGFDFITYFTAPAAVQGSFVTNTVDGAFGRDTFRDVEALVGSYFDDVLIGAGGDDGFNGTHGDDRIVGGGGDDVLFDFAGNDQLIAGAGDDLLIGRGGRDRLAGGPNNDRLFAGKGNDRLGGGPGGDFLAGGDGNDRLRGGPSADRCIGHGGRDRIRGCESIVDEGSRASRAPFRTGLALEAVGFPRSLLSG